MPKKKTIVIFSIVMSMLCWYLFDIISHNLIINAEVYAIQIGRYKERESVDSIIQELQEKSFVPFEYKKKEYVVIVGIYKDYKEAITMAKQISEAGITCLLRNYQIPESKIIYVEKGEYDKLKEYLK